MLNVLLFIILLYMYNAKLTTAARTSDALLLRI